MTRFKQPLFGGLTDAVVHEAVHAVGGAVICSECKAKMPGVIVVEGTPGGVIG